MRAIGDGVGNRRLRERKPKTITRSDPAAESSHPVVEDRTLCGTEVGTSSFCGARQKHLDGGFQAR